MDQPYQNNNNEYNNGGYNNGYNNGGGYNNNGYNNGNNGNGDPGTPGPGKGNDPKKQNIFLLVLAGGLFLDISPVWFVILSAAAGIVLKGLEVRG